MMFRTRPLLAPADPVLWLVRHGESTWNTLGLAQGHCDQARLTRRGTHQAGEVAHRLRGHPIGAVYASDLQRATATAAPLAAALGLATVRDARLRERGLGMLEGTASAAVPAALSGVAEGRVLDPDARPPDGESLRDLYWRVAGFVDDILSSSPAEEIAVVAHGGSLRVLTAYLRGVPVERMSWGPLANGTVTAVRLQPAHSRERETR
jgi:probable phosphoglycerate mutase